MTELLSTETETFIGNLLFNGGGLNCGTPARPSRGKRLGLAAWAV
jgi:hypothetical protein